MAQHDYNIGDQNGFDFLVDLNNALSAIVTNNAGPSEPNPTFANMFWFDTNNDLMKMRNEANSAWVIVAKKDGSSTAAATGTSVDFTSIPAAVMEVTLHYIGVSVDLSGTNRQPGVRLGTSGGIVTTGYDQISSVIGGGDNATSSAFSIELSDTSNTLDGHMTLKRIAVGSDIWSASHSIKSGSSVACGGGNLNLGAELTQIRFVPDALFGTTEFDAGTLSVTWSY